MLLLAIKILTSGDRWRPLPLSMSSYPVLLSILYLSLLIKHTLSIKSSVIEFGGAGLQDSMPDSLNLLPPVQFSVK